MVQDLERCLVGGTFDRFHKGHEHLLKESLKRTRFLEVWITSDAMASKKSDLVEPFSKRRHSVLEWADANAKGFVKTFELKDMFGPAPSRDDCDGIVCTPETLSNCQEINLMRMKNDLVPLTIIEVNHLCDISGGIVSSSRVRSGVISRSGELWFPPSVQLKNFKMTKQAEAFLKHPSGVLFQGPEEYPEIAMKEAIDSVDLGQIITVGDVCTNAAIEIGVIPDVALVDGLTKRQKVDYSFDHVPFEERIHCQNPAGMITTDLISSLKYAIHSDGTTLVDVNGEEDLAPLVIHLMAPLHSNIFYGQPGKGAVLAVTTEEMKSRCKTILELFEEIQ